MRRETWRAQVFELWDGGICVLKRRKQTLINIDDKFCLNIRISLTLSLKAMSTISLECCERLSTHQNSEISVRDKK